MYTSSIFSFRHYSLMTPYCWLSIDMLIMIHTDATSNAITNKVNMTMEIPITQTVHLASFSCCFPTSNHLILCSSFSLFALLSLRYSRSVSSKIPPSSSMFFSIKWLYIFYFNINSQNYYIL